MSIGMVESRDDAAPAAARATSGLVSGERWREIILGLLLLLCYGFFYQVPAWNEYSRYDLVVAIVDQRTLQIDELHENTGDKAFYDGHYYSDKAPGTALLGVPVYGALRGAAALTGSARPDERQMMHALAFAVCGLPTALLAVLMLRFLRAHVEEWWALTMSVGYGLGSIAFPFATMFFGHAAATFFLFAAFYLLWRARADGKLWRLPVAGAAAGWAVLAEYPVALGVFVLLGYCLWCHRERTLLFVAGGLPVAAVLLGYNWLAFDHPLRLGYQYATVFGEQNSQGLIGVVRPNLAVASDLLLSARGLLRLSPWFALAPLGLLYTRRREARAEVITCAAVALVFLTYNSGALNPFGGWTPGPRYLLPALPFATVLVALAPRVFRPLIALQIAYSIVLVGVATATMPNAPEANLSPLRDLWLPRLLSRDLAETTAWLRWGLHGLQPLFLIGFGFGLAGIALFATAAATRAGNRVATAAAIALAVLVLAFSMPLAPSLGGNPLLVGSDRREIAIDDAGATRGLANTDGSTIRPWAQLTNGDAALTGTKVIFSIYSPTGERVWAAWHGDVAWQAGERKRLLVEWQPGGTAPGIYRLDVAVTSADERIVYASMVNAAQITIQPQPSRATPRAFVTTAHPA